MAAAGQEDGRALGRGSGLSSPFWVMMRSAVLPGWGQATNGKWGKAIVLGGADGLLVYGVLREERLASRTADPVEKRHHRARKKDYLWWSAFATLITMGDAYVDAHLRGFRAEFSPEDSALWLRYEVGL